MELGSHATTVLERAGVSTVADLLKHSSSDLAHIPGFDTRCEKAVGSGLLRVGLAAEASRGPDAGSPRGTGPVARGGEACGPSRAAGAGVSRQDIVDHVDALPIESLGLSVRTVNCLRRARIRTVGEARARSADELRAIPNFGKKSEQDLVDSLRRARGGDWPSVGPSEDAQAREPSQPVAGAGIDAVKLQVLSELCDRGATLQEMGDALGVTRERARQLLGKFGLRERQREGKALAAQAERDRHAEEIMVRFSHGLDEAEIAAGLGVPASLVTIVIRDHATQEMRARRRAARSSRRSAGSLRYSNEDLLDAIRWAVAQCEHSTISSGEYDRLAAEHSLPSKMLISTRFDTWSAAMRAAGFEPKGAGRGNYTRKWTAGACRRALIALVSEMGEPPTVNQYELIASGDDALPSLATVRNRLGVWSVVMAGIVEALATTRKVVNGLDLHNQVEPDRSDAIWLAYLGEELTDQELADLRDCDVFNWDAYFSPGGDS